MGWIEGLNASVDYIEEHLDGDVDIARAASFASCTEGQFRRIFSYLAGMGLAEYVRKRRLSCAALDLSRGERVLDVAVRYGYSSPTAFNRAFQEVLGMSPSEARCPGAHLLVFPRCTFALTVTGAEPLPWRVVPQQGMRLVGISASCGAAQGNPLVQMSSSGRERAWAVFGRELRKMGLSNGFSRWRMGRGLKESSGSTCQRTMAKATR